MGVALVGNKIENIGINGKKVGGAAMDGKNIYKKPILIQKFDYIGNIQNITLQPGNYLLECWGAGYNKSGGYSFLYTSISSTTILYVVVGGVGNFPIPVTTCSLVAGSDQFGGSGGAGGYNGGGSGGAGGNGIRPSSTYNYYCYGGIPGVGGSGATHISKFSGLINNTTVRNTKYK